MTSRTSRWIGASLVGAAVSMAVAPTALNFDPWAWLVWGREVAHLDLDTTGGPSWKPFPVLITAPLSLLGGATPTVWMFLMRAAGILGLVAVGAVATQLARTASPRRWAPMVAATTAVVSLLLAPDATPRWVRTVAVGHTAALAGGCTVWAIHAHLAGRRRTAWFALVAASLIRPEAWPILIGYGVWLAWTRPTWPWRLGVGSGWVLTATLWFGGDLWGSGSAVHGADMAQSGPATFGDRIDRVVEVTVGMVPAAVWVLAVVAVTGATMSRWNRRRPGAPEANPVDTTVLVLTGLAAAWVAVVAGLTIVLGYAALSRFLISPAAVICIVGAVGAVRIAERVADLASPTAEPGRRPIDLAVGAALAAGLALSVTPVAGLATVWEETVERGEITADLSSAYDAAADTAGGRDRLLACGQVTIEHRPLVRPQLAWLLEEPLHRVHTARDPVAPGVMFIVRGSRIDRHQISRPADEWRELAVNRHWRVLAIRCPVLTEDTGPSAPTSLDDKPN